jgi:hypothetical protein
MLGVSNNPFSPFKRSSLVDRKGVIESVTSSEQVKRPHGATAAALEGIPAAMGTQLCGDKDHRAEPDENPMPARSKNAHRRLRQPPPGCGRVAADDASTSVGSEESRSPVMSVASKRSNRQSRRNRAKNIAVSGLCDLFRYERA